MLAYIWLHVISIVFFRLVPPRGKLYDGLLIRSKAYYPHGEARDLRLMSYITDEMGHCRRDDLPERGVAVVANEGLLLRIYRKSCTAKQSIKAE